MSDRGEYRPFFGSILDDPDFQSMPGDTFKVFFALKHMLGPAGIGVPRKAELAEVCGKSLTEIEVALDELEQPKPDEEHGWILRERNIVWLVNGLRHELLKPNNHPHREGIARQLRAVGDKPIVGKFRAYYPEWFGQNGSPEGVKREPNRDPKGSPEGVKRHKTKRDDTKQDETRREDEARARDKTPEPTSSLSQLVDRFLETFYRSATPERREEIKQQLRDSLSDQGARIRRGEFVKARNSAHLASCLTDTIRAEIKNPDKAIVVVLRKLCDPELDSQRRTVTEAASNNNKATERKERLYHDAKVAAAATWSKEHIDEHVELERGAIMAIPGDTQVGAIARSERVLQEIGKRIAFPAFEAWAP